MSIHEIETKARELRELQRMQEELADEITALQDAIKATMGDREQMIVGEYKISWKAVESHRIDTASLKKLMPEVAEQFTRITATRRFTVQ